MAVSSRLLALLQIATSLSLISGQAIRSGSGVVDNAFEMVGYSGASAQQMFLSSPTKVIIIDKTENNPTQLNGKPVWGTEYDTESNTIRSMEINSNTFCAGGNVLGNGTWLNVGGNQGVLTGGLPTTATQNPYGDADGGKSMRLFNPCSDGSCNWSETTPMTSRRWYPTLETLDDGSIIIIGGDMYGGYVNDLGQNNPTYEYFPSKGNVTGLNLLTTTLPANLYPLTFLLPSGNLFINANWGNTIFNYKTGTESDLPNVPHSVRTYPGSATNGMLPLTPANNWTATLLFCGGTNLQPDQWNTTWNIAAYDTDSTCVRISPDTTATWEDDDALFEGRSMGNLIALPDGRYFLLNGINKGTAGYGSNTTWAIGQSYGTDPIYSPAYYDPAAPSGSRWSRPSSLKDSTVPRLYHSTATILPDGSILSSGSNPNADYIANGTAGYPWFTEYRVERFYPDYYTKPRPNPKGLPETLSYGGAYFNVTLPATDLASADAIEETKVVILRPGFSTHAINMGQRYVQLNSKYTNNTDGSATLHVSQLPPNAAVIAPGPAYVYVVVKGVPSMGQSVMIGNGVIGTQPTSTVADLPGTVPAIVAGAQTYNNQAGLSSSNSSGSSSSSSSKGGKNSGASQLEQTVGTWLFSAVVMLMGASMVF